MLRDVERLHCFVFACLFVFSFVLFEIGPYHYEAPVDLKLNYVDTKASNTLLPLPHPSMQGLKVRTIMPALELLFGVGPK